MKRIKIQKFKFSEFYSSHTTDRPLFTLCYISDKIKNKIKAYGTFSSCRAYSTDMIRTMISKKKHTDDRHSYYIEKHDPIKLNNVLLGISLSINVEKLLNVIRILNCYNTIGNLPKFKLIGSSHVKKINLWFVKIPMKYKEKPFLMSMATLLIRVLVTISNEELNKIENIDDIEKYFYKHRLSKDNNFKFEDKDTLYKEYNYLKLRLIMENHKKLFFGLGKKLYFQ